MKYKIKFDKLPTQAKVFDNDHTRTIVQSMGLGGGKSYNLAMKLIKLSRINRGYAGGLLCPTYTDFRRDMRPHFEDILETNRVPYKYHGSDKCYYFPWNKKPLYVLTGDRPIAGPNLAYCGINEFSLMTYERINEMLRRVRVKDAPLLQRILVGTPEDVHGWLDEFIERQSEQGEDKFVIHYGGTEENTYIDDDYVQDLTALLDPESLSVFKDGIPSRIGGDYFYYSYDEDRNVCREAEYIKDKTIHIGVDFNVGKMTASFSHKVGNEQHFFDEIFLQHANANTGDLAKSIRASKYPVEFMVITCDASGNNKTTKTNEVLMSDVKILRDYGFRVRFKSANPRLRKRQLLMNSMLYHNRIKINPRCKYLRKDFKLTRQKDDFTKDEGKQKAFSHFSDGADYVVDYEHGEQFKSKIYTSRR